MQSIEIRKAIQADLLILQSLGRQTFLETFADSNTETDMDNYLPESFGIEKLTIELYDPNSEFYLAVIDRIPIGYLKINYAEAQTELKANQAIEIERIYVLKELHKKKLGRHFMIMHWTWHNTEMQNTYG